MARFDRRACRLLLQTCAATVALKSSVCHATDRTWLSAVDGIFSEPAKWSGGAVPGSADTAHFTAAGTYSINFFGSESNQQLVASDGTVTLDIQSKTYLLTTTGTTSLRVGAQNNPPLSVGRLVVASGTLSSQAAVVGETILAQGQMTVDNATWTANGSAITVGLGGVGTLDVINSGRVDAGTIIFGNNTNIAGDGTVGIAGGNGRAELTASNRLVVGSAGFGTLTIESSGRAGCTSATDDFIIANANGSHGVVHVNRSGGIQGELDVTRDIRVGNGGLGTLLVDGGVVTCRTLLVSPTLGSTGFVSITNTGSISASSVNLASSGARLDLVSGYLSTGTVVLGAGSFNWTAGTVNLSSGSAGVNIGTTNSLPGAESIGSGKALIATGHLTLGGGLGVGSLNVSGGGHLLAPLYVDGGSVLGDGTNSLMICAAPSVSDIPTIGGSHGDGTLTIQNGAALLTDDFNIGGAATASGTVLLSGAGTIWGVATATSDAVTSIGYDGTGYVQLSGGAVFSQGVGVHNVVTIIGSHAGSRGTLIVDGAGSSWLMSPTSNNSQLSIGLEGSGNLSVLNGASLSCGGGMVGAGSFGTGTVAVNGMGSRWINTRSLSIGESGTGTLSVLSGATASAQSSSYVGDLPASHGTVLIDGNGSALSLAQDLYVGNQGAGAVTVSGGGSISFRGGLAGAGSLGTGTAIVTGLGSQWTNTASLSIGESGTGALSILAGATASVQSSSYVGDLPASHGTVLVDGNGSGLNIAQDLYVGNRGAGTVTISGGGSLSCAHAYIGSGTAGIGLVVLQDPGSNWTCSSIDIGQGQAGTLSVSPGAAVSVSGTINVWPGGEISDNNGSISAGFINLQTGTFSGVGTLAAGISNTNGTIDVPGGTLNLLNSVTNTNLSTLTKTGAGTVVMANLSQAGNGSLLVSNGAVNLVTDLGPGLPSVNVSVTQPGGAINFGATQHLLALNVNAGHAALTSGGAKVLVTRSLSINSAAGQLDLANGAMILDYPGPVSPISTVKSWFATGYASGSWSGNGIVSSTAATMPRAALGYAEAIDLFSTFPASFFGQSVDNTSILIRYTLAGDANLDGTVNTLDFNSLAANFSLGGRVWRNGDFNYDGVANALDFNAIASNFGQTLSGAPLGTVVPEPAYCMTLLLAALLTARHRRHQIYARNSPWSAS